MVHLNAPRIVYVDWFTKRFRHPIDSSVVGKMTAGSLCAALGVTVDACLWEYHAESATAGCRAPKIEQTILFSCHKRMVETVFCTLRKCMCMDNFFSLQHRCSGAFLYYEGKNCSCFVRSRLVSDTGLKPRSVCVSGCSRLILCDLYRSIYRNFKALLWLLDWNWAFMS